MVGVLAKESVRHRSERSMWDIDAERDHSYKNNKKRVQKGPSALWFENLVKWKAYRS